MNLYTITNTLSGLDLGTFEAASPEAPRRDPPDLAERLAAVEWGEIEDYYVDDAEISRKRADWDSSKEAWEDLRDRLLRATWARRVEILRQMSQVEDQWGDDPSTQECRRLLGL